MKKIILFVSSSFIIACSSSDDQKIIHPDLNNTDIKISKLGVDKVYIEHSNLNEGTAFHYKAINEKEYQTSTNHLITNLKPATTYEIVLKNPSSTSKKTTFTTSAFLLENTINQKNNGYPFTKSNLISNKKYTITVKDPLPFSQIDTYLIYESKKDSIKLNSEIKKGEKTFTFTIPDNVIPSNRSIDAYLGFKVNNKMQYFFHYHNNLDSDGMIRLDIKEKAPVFHVENIEPKILMIHPAKRLSTTRLYFIKIEGELFTHPIFENNQYGKGLKPKHLSLIIFNKDKKTEVHSLNYDYSVNEQDMDKKDNYITLASKINSISPNILDTYLHSTGAIQYFTSYFPKGEYYMQAKFLMEDGSFYETDFCPWTTPGIGL